MENEKIFDRLKKNLRDGASISEAEIDQFISAIRVLHVKRKKSILNEGNIPNFLIFVNQGLIRMYSTDEKMQEQTFDFGAEGDWFGDLECFRDRKPSSFNIEAIEDSQLLLIGYSDLQRLYVEIPALERIARLNTEEKYIRLLNRLKKINHSYYTLEERYEEFLRVYSNIVFRVPSTIAASYLGVTPETLSRLKKNILRNVNLQSKST